MAKALQGRLLLFTNCLEEEFSDTQKGERAQKKGRGFYTPALLRSSASFFDLAC